jgi:hypothetical protein
MAIGIGENLGNSFGYAKDTLVGHYGRWILLIVFGLIPIIGWLFLSGYIVRVLRGGEAQIDKLGRMFIDGILAWIIGVIYMIIPILALLFFGGAALVTLVLEHMTTLNSADVATAFFGIGVGLILVIILAIVFGVLGTLGVIRFAKTGSFGAAFKAGDIFEVAGKIGWGHYIISWLVIVIIISVIGFILGLIPVINWILLLILAPLFGIWEARFYANLYESV